MTEPPPLIEADAMPIPRAGRRFAAVAVVCLLVGWGALTALSVAVDPRAEFGTGWVDPIVAPKGGSFGAKLQLARDVPEGAAMVRTVVLGSSTAMQLRTSVLAELGHGPAVNLASESTVLGDLGRAWSEARAALPGLEHALLFVDLHMLLAEPDAALDAAPDRGEALLRAATSRSYLEDTVHAIAIHVGLAKGTGDAPRFTAHGDLLANETLGGDQRGDERFDRHAPLLDEPALDATAVASLAATVGRMREDGANVTLVLQPVHPDVLARADEAGGDTAARIEEARLALRGLCAPGVAAWVAQDLGGSAWQPAGFSDGIHHGPQEAAGIVRVAMGGRGECA